MEVDEGTTIVRCLGWRNISNIVFSNYPPFLVVFDIAASFRDKIKSLNDKFFYFFIFLFMHFCPGTITTHAESINSDLQRGLDRRL